jgi:hypothetical protein
MVFAHDTFMQNYFHEFIKWNLTIFQQIILFIFSSNEKLFFYEYSNFFAFRSRFPLRICTLIIQHFTRYMMTSSTIVVLLRTELTWDNWNVFLLFLSLFQSHKNIFFLITFNYFFFLFSLCFSSTFHVNDWKSTEFVLQHVFFFYSWNLLSDPIDKNNCGRRRVQTVVDRITDDNAMINSSMQVILDFRRENFSLLARKLFRISQRENGKFARERKIASCGFFRHVRHKQTFLLSLLLYTCSILFI